MVHYTLCSLFAARGMAKRNTMHCVAYTQPVKYISGTLYTMSPNTRHAEWNIIHQVVYTKPVEWQSGTPYTIWPKQQTLNGTQHTV